MKDFREIEIKPGNFIVYVTLHGHKPILTYAFVREAEENRIKVEPVLRSDYRKGNIGWLRGVSEMPKQTWLRVPENIAVVME